MKALITGANGQLGVALIRALSGNASNIRAIGLSRSDLDITDYSAVRQIISGDKPDFLINCAAYTAVDRAETERDAAFAINERGAANLAKACAEHGVFMVHFSTDYVFDGRSERPYVETDPTAPLGVYGQSKLAGERAVAACAAHALVLRLSWVYANDGANFYKTMLRLARERDQLRVVADQFGTPNFTGDLADAVVALLARPMASLRENSGLYHLSAHGITTWHGFASEIFAHAKLDRRPRVEAIATSDYPTPVTRPAYSALDSSRFTTTFGIAMPDWQAGLARCLAERAESA